MAKIQNRRHSTATDNAAAELVTAHTEIMDAWFEQWRTQERTRIEVAFKKKRPSEHQRRQLA
jgi:hypothetical protein